MPLCRSVCPDHDCNPEVNEHKKHGSWSHWVQSDPSLVQSDPSPDLVDELVEDAVDGLADEGAVRHELAIDAVEDGLEVVALARVLGVEEIEQLGEEVLRDASCNQWKLGSIQPASRLA